MNTPSRATLPPLPSGIRMLTNDEAKNLDARAKMTGYSADNCITCRRRRTFTWLGPDGQPAEYDCPCASQYLLFRYLRYSGVPLSYQRLGWGDYTHLSPSVIDQVAPFLANRQRLLDAGFGLVLHGTRGNGKTLLAYLLLKEMLGDGVRCYSTTFADMLSDFMEGFSDKEMRRWFMQTVRSIPVLYIDDVGREYQTGTDKFVSPDERERRQSSRADNRPGALRESMLEAVIRERVANCLPTLISTNFTPDEIQSGYGGHTMSLLGEKSLFVEVTGADRRPEINRREQDYIMQGLTRPIVIDRIGV